ncbi:GNAT family N-acetyltransferase [Microbacterium sp. NPDC090225]|uniref:GNAT family N-acetyltransferase n=1 Tax=Microbacterium sp. NPDC090225 TaxID=3364207 RepID=UPI00382977C3
MIRTADLSGTDAVAVGRLVKDYLRQTESEKVAHGAAPAPASDALPAAYRREVDDPADAYAGCPVFVAEIDGEVVGVVVLRPDAGGVEIKRLWASPLVRGRGVGSGLLDAAITAGEGDVRLSVWEWRTDVIRLYESRGFVRVPSWDARPALVCMRFSSRERS